MKLIIIFIMFFYVINADAATGINKQKITIKQADALVLVALGPEAEKLPDLVIIPPPDSRISNGKINSSRFGVFEVTTASSDGGVVFAVDFYTGDVFSASITCDEIKNKKLVELQKKVRRSLRLTDTQYRKIKTRGPLCDE